MPVETSEATEKGNRAHSRERKERPCRGCGRVLPAYVLHTHEGLCVRAAVLPGQRFQILAATTVGGRKNRSIQRRPIWVEVIRAVGTGWLVRSIESGRELTVKSPRRIIDWAQFAPGLEKEPAA